MPEESQPIADIRNQLKAEQKARQDMEAELTELREFRQAETFRKAGFDPDSGPGKALLKLHEGGEMTADALKATAEAYGLQVGEATPQGEAALPAATQERLGVQAQMNSITGQAAPTGVKSLTHDELKALADRDPRAAAAALQAGQVDMSTAPAGLGRQLEANRNFNPLGR